MSLMHYGDTDFGRKQADGTPMKTMEYVKPTTKLMGNRMGLTQADAVQVAKMYKCEGQQKKFKLCPLNPKACMKEDCVCSQGSGFLKTIDGGCNRCVPSCTDIPQMFDPSKPCGCPAGETKKRIDTMVYCEKVTTTTTTTTPPKGNLPKCKGDPTTFSAEGYSCNNYAEGDYWCASDRDTKTQLLAEEVCSKCGKCQ